MAAGWHNRWHPAIEPAGEIEPGVATTVETREGTDGVIGPSSTHDDLGRLDFSRAHQLVGPYYIKGAKPSDLLEIEVLEVSTKPFGFTAIFPGFGLLADLFPDPYLLKWELADGFGRSDRLPGVAVPEAAFAGVIGVAPSEAFLAEARELDRSIAAAGGPVIPDQPEGAVPALAADGLRTIPPRELGGNLDIRQLRPGAKLLLRAQVPGGMLSVGDLHFSQGDGEVCGSGIECAGTVTFRVSIVEDASWQPRMPAFSSPGEPSRPSFATTGIPRGIEGPRIDLTSAARDALGEMLEYLCAEHDLEREAAYALMSAVVDLRISQLVNMPHPLVTAFVPLDIFVP
jgi:formamidase